jgi:hypothetical protein
VKLRRVQPRGAIPRRADVALAESIALAAVVVIAARERAELTAPDTRRD